MLIKERFDGFEADERLISALRHMIMTEVDIIPLLDMVSEYGARERNGR